MFRPLSGLAIRTKILISSALTLTLISVFVFVYYPIQQKKQIFVTVKKSNLNLAEIISFGVGLGMGTGKFAAVTQAMNWAKSDQNLAYIIILDEKNSIMANYNPGNLNLDIPYLLRKNEIRNIDGHPIHIISLPINYQDSHYGTLLFGSSLDAFNRNISKNLMTTFFVSVSILIFGIIASFFLGGIITKPLEELRDAADQIARGNHNIEIPISTTDEVGVLGTVLKDMIGNILKTLRESEEKFRSISSSAQDAIIMINDRGDITFWNTAAEKMLGHKSEDVQGKDLHELIVPKRYLDSFKKGFANFVKTGKGSAINKVVDVVAHRKDGTEFPVELSMSAFKLADKWNAVGFLRDVSERKRTEDEIRHLVMAIYQTSEIIVVTDRLGEITYVNPAFEKITGNKSSEVIGRKPGLISSGRHDHAFYSEMWEKISNGKTWRGQFVNRKKDGTIFKVEATISPVYSEDGDIVSYVGVMRDITEELKLEEKRKDLQEKVERAKRMESMGILAGGVAHDLNNILGPIVGYSELLLLDTFGDDKTRAKIKLISKAAHDAADIIQDLLALARRGRYQMATVNLNDVVGLFMESPAYLELIRTNPEIKINLKLDETIANITGSTPHLSKAIMNLIFNACDAMPTGGELNIQTSQRYIEELHGGYANIDRGEYVILSIQDTGMGIALEDLEKIFEPYYSNKEMGSSGSGLGLSVVYGVVKDHKGYYDVSSTVGEGTEFLLYFPATELAIKDESGIEVDIKGSERILIVDDDQRQREMASEILSGLGYHVDIVGNGRDTLEYLKENKVDMVLLDMIMEKGFDGLDTYREIIKLHAGQKAVIVSGFSATERVIKMQELGAGQYVKKPYTIDILGKAIRHELDKETITNYSG